MDKSFRAGLLSHSLDLLLKSALSSHDEAVLAWQEWRINYDINLTPWNEVRILGAVANRIDWLEPNSPIRPRLMGIRKFLWVQTQFCLNKTRAGLKVLNNEGIPILLLKGGARIAEDSASAQERLIRDLDILVPLNLQEKAFRALEAAGWKLVPLPWQIASFNKAPISGHHAWSLALDGGEIDLHHYSNHLNRLLGDDEEFWRHSKILDWQGISVHVLCPSHALITILIHGLRWSQDGSADWAIDACALVDQKKIDWDMFILEGKNRLVQAIIFSGLTYLKESLGRPIPSFVIDGLKDQIDDEMLSELNDFYRVAASPTTPHQVECFHNLAFRRVQNKRLIPKLTSSSLIHIFNTNLKLSEGEVFCLNVSPSKMTYDWLVLEIQVPTPPSLDINKLTGRFSSVGFEMKYSIPDAIRRDEQGVVGIFRMEISVSVIFMRGIEEINFSYWFENAKVQKLLLGVNVYTGRA